VNCAIIDRETMAVTVATQSSSPIINGGKRRLMQISAAANVSTTMAWRILLLGAPLKE
jgi:hypothetical protein